MSDMDNLDPALAAVLQRMRSGKAPRPEDAQLLEHHLTTDAMVPGVRNRAAWQEHAKHHSNDGVYLHADINDFGAVNKTFGEDTGDDVITHFGSVLRDAGQKHAARTFRRGGDEFVQWYLDPEHAKTAAAEIQQKLKESPHPVTASLGLGYGRHQAETAMRAAKGKKNAEAPETIIHSVLDASPPIGWRQAEEGVKERRRKMLEGNAAPEALAKSDEETVVSTHPIHNAQPFVMMSGESPRFPTAYGDGDGHAALRDQLLRRGHQFEETQGHYGSPERSFVIHNLGLAEARKASSIAMARIRSCCTPMVPMPTTSTRPRAGPTATSNQRTQTKAGPRSTTR